MQKVHFSMMPRLRTVTSVLSWLRRVSGHTGSQKLKKRTFQGSLLAQKRVPMHRLYTCTLRPSLLWYVAKTGHTDSHGAFSQCWQSMGTKRAFTSGNSPSQYRSMRIHWMARRCRKWSGSLIGTLFSD